MKPLAQVLHVLNSLVDEKVIDSYVIGGAIAAMYYLEPFETNDVDVFVNIMPSGSGLISLHPIYQALSKRGHTSSSNEGVDIGGVTVQFLPVATALTMDMLKTGQRVKIGGVETFIGSAEHLYLEAKRVGRPKDMVRAAMFEDARILDGAKLKALQTLSSRQPIPGRSR